MHLTLILLFSLLPFTISQKVIKTSLGPVLGTSDPTNSVFSFKSVPFAKPPIGTRRFALPEALDPWNDVIDARNQSFACIGGKRQFDVSENCLYLAIFTSQRCIETLCPVIVFLNDFENEKLPDDFIRERYTSRDVVFVVPAFRLGVFGQFFLGTSPVLNQNLNVYDVIQSLNFIHNQIKEFGGDPAQVTLMGHSTGATLTLALGFSNVVDPDMVMFQQIISLSAPGVFAASDHIIDTSFLVARKLNCYSGNRKHRQGSNRPEIINCLRKMDASIFQKLQNELGHRGFRSISIVLGDPFIQNNVSIENLKKHSPPRRMISGVTEFEFRYIPYFAHFEIGNFLDFNNTFSVYHHYHDVAHDHPTEGVHAGAAAVFVSAATYSEALTNSGGEVYLFESRQKPFSSHLSDMQYFIGIHRELFHRPDMDIVDSFYSKLLVNFTKYGEPSPIWEKMDVKKMNFLAVQVDSKTNTGPEMLNGFHQKEKEMWTIDMMQFDREETAKLAESGYYTQEVEDYEYVDIEPMSANTAQSRLGEKRGSNLFNDWWTYAIIIVGSLALAFWLTRMRKNQHDRLV